MTMWYSIPSTAVVTRCEGAEETRSVAKRAMPRRRVSISICQTMERIDRRSLFLLAFEPGTPAVWPFVALTPPPTLPRKCNAKGTPSAYLTAFREISENSQCGRHVQRSNQQEQGVCSIRTTLRGWWLCPVNAAHELPSIGFFGCPSSSFARAKLWHCKAGGSVKQGTIFMSMAPLPNPSSPHRQI